MSINKKIKQHFHEWWSPKKKKRNLHLKSSDLRGFLGKKERYVDGFNCKL